MRARALIVASCAALLVVAGAAQAASPLTTYDAALVGMRPTPGAEALVRAAGGTPVARKLGIWRLDSARAAAIAPALRRAGLLRYVEPDRPQPEAHLTAGDPLATPELGWYLYRLGADQVEPPPAGVPISLVDSGLDMTHTEFKTRPSTTLLNAQPSLSWGSELYHGTEVASVAAAPEDGYGAVGIYPTAALRIFAISTVFDAPRTSDVVRGIVMAGAFGRTVINLSLSGSQRSQAEEDAIRGAIRNGALVVAAAGNEFSRGSPPQYPASYPHVLTVGSTGKTDAPSSFSNRSTSIDLAAPGEAIPVEHPTDPAVWTTVQGTSFAAPIVAAAAAWVWTVRPELDAGQLAEVLRSTATDVEAAGFDDRTGYGIPSIPAAIAAPPPPRDVQEPNDDIDEITAGRLFASGRPPLTTVSKRTAKITAYLDQNEDPGDVYRVVVPARKTLTATVAGDTNLGTILWSSAAKTVFATGTSAMKWQLDGSNRAGKRAEQVVYRNPGRKAVSAYLDIWFAKGSARRATYTATVTVR
jgi:hypothetical protein